MAVAFLAARPPSGDTLGQPHWWVVGSIVRSLGGRNSRPHSQPASAFQLLILFDQLSVPGGAAGEEFLAYLLYLLNYPKINGRNSFPALPIEPFASRWHLLLRRSVWRGW